MPQLKALYKVSDYFTIKVHKMDSDDGRVQFKGEHDIWFTWHDGRYIAEKVKHVCENHLNIKFDKSKLDYI